MKMKQMRKACFYIWAEYSAKCLMGIAGDIIQFIGSFQVGNHHCKMAYDEVVFSFSKRLKYLK